MSGPYQSTRQQTTAAVGSVSPPPRYAQVADALMRDIELGRYPVGSLLPSEHELSERYAVSRHTLREATRRLVERGLISRKAGIGTRVTARTVDTRYVASINALEDLFEYTRQTRLNVIVERLVEADEALASFLHCRTRQTWLSFETRRYPLAGGKPIAHMTAYLPPAFEAVRDHLHEQGVSVCRLLEQHYGAHIVEVQQSAEAIALPADIAELLEAEPGAPALRVARLYSGADGRLLTASVNVHPQDRFTLVTGWRLDWQPTNA
jgi:GntR family transcriptional regulator